MDVHAAGAVEEDSKQAAVDSLERRPEPEQRRRTPKAAPARSVGNGRLAWLQPVPQPLKRTRAHGGVSDGGYAVAEKKRWRGVGLVRMVLHAHEWVIWRAFGQPCVVQEVGYGLMEVTKMEGLLEWHHLGSSAHLTSEQTPQLSPLLNSVALNAVALIP